MRTATVRVDGLIDLVVEALPSATSIIQGIFSRRLSSAIFFVYRLPADSFKAAPVVGIILLTS